MPGPHHVPAHFCGVDVDKTDVRCLQRLFWYGALLARKNSSSGEARFRSPLGVSI